MRGARLRWKDHLSGRRDVLYERIADEPGIHFRSLIRETGIPSGSAAYHLRVLEELGYIESRRVGYWKRYAPAGSSWNCTEGDYYAQREGVRDILDAVAKNPGLSQRELSEIFGGSRSTLQHRLQRLREEGLVEARGPCREKRYYLGGKP